MRGLLGGFKAVNHRLNQRWFLPAQYLRYYRAVVRQAGESARVILHFGAGSGAVCREWRLFGDRSFVAVDRDEARLRANRARLCVVADGAALPFRAGAVDLVATEHTFEHLEDPKAVLRELHRVLRPRGSVIFAVPNRGSYVALAARAAPFPLHRWFYRLHHGAAGDGGHDLTPTFYRLNTEGTIARAAAETGLRLAECRSFAGGPTYTLALPPPLHVLAMVWHKLLERAPALSPLRLNLVGALVKDAGGPRR